MALSHIRNWLTRFGTLSAHPAAFAIVLLYAVGWFMFEHHTFDWHAVATLIVWLMTLTIQRSEHRDTQAIHAKLDELLHATGGARNELTLLDDDEPEDIEKHRTLARVGD